MSNWYQKTIFFPSGRLSETFIGTYLSRYTLDTSAEQQFIDGSGVIMSNLETDPNLSTIYKDDYPLTKFRKASIFDGTISPTLVYDPPITGLEDRTTGNVIGQTISVCWPESFINDLNRNPQPEMDLFSGVYVIT